MKSHPDHVFIRLLIFVLLALPCQTIHGQSADGDYVSRQEYEDLKQQMLDLKKELDSIKKQNAATKNQISPAKKTATTTTPPESAPAPPATGPTQESSKGSSPSSLLNAALEDFTPGSTKFHIAGWASATFEARDHNVSNFSATFNPIFLWELTPKLMFDARLEIEPSGSGTNIELEYAEMTYALNDYMTLGLGQFLSPSNVFVERFEAQWINKMPDRPLAVYDGILPERSFGVELRGGIPLGSMRANYAFYVSNGPNLNVFSPDRIGTLEFNNFSDNNDDKAFGGRVGLVPFPGIEFGYAFETARPGTQGTSFADVRSLLQSVDLNITRTSDLLPGRFDFHAQYAWSEVDHAVYDPDGVFGFGPIAFKSKQDGGYAQLAYRPTKADISFLKNLEVVGRWDHLSRAPSGLGAPQEERWTVGLDYWLGPSTVFKLAYEWDNRRDEPDANAFFFQAAMGF